MYEFTPSQRRSKPVRSPRNLGGAWLRAKSASSTIDNITAESLIDEFKSAIEEKVAETQLVEKNQPAVEIETGEAPSPSKIPLVKSKEDIEREKEKKRKPNSLKMRVRVLSHLQLMMLI